MRVKIGDVGSNTVPANLDARKVWMVSQPWNGVLYAVPQGAAFFMERTLDTERVLQATKALILNSLVNNYAVERVAFGYEKPGDQAPIDLYLQHLQLDINDAPNKRKDIPGVYIDETERITTKQNYDEFVRDLFVLKMESVFFYAPRDKYSERHGEELPLQPRIREYLFGLLPLFTEILKVKVDYTPFDIIPIDKETRATENTKWMKFVTAVLIKPLKTGGQINRYVKDFQVVPYYIRRLIEKRGNNFYLKTANVQSTEFIFALFSLMPFMNAENDKLFELKMLEWERQHKPE